MRVNVKLYAALRRYVSETAPGVGRPLELADGSTVEDAVRIVGIPSSMPLVTMVNGTVRQADHALSDGDTLHMFPPVVGG